MSSLEHEPFDNDLFDPPPKQHKQQQQSTSFGSQSAYQQPYAKQQQQRAATSSSSATTTTTTTTSHLSTAKNASGHTNMPSGISGGSSSEIRTSIKQNTDTNTERSRSPYPDYQYSPKSLPVSHIVQSGSYVEILKQGGGASSSSAVGNAAFTPVQRTTTKSATTTNDISPSHHQQNQKRHHRSIAACHNKSYGDFLTITPRRKGNKLVIPAGYEKEQANEQLDDYHNHQYRQNLPHSIEPLHLLGISDEKNYTFLDYRAMEAISNADTLEMGTSISGGNSSSSNATHNKIKIRDRYNEHNNQLITSTTSSSSASASNVIVNKKQSIAEVSTEYQYFMREKNLSPPTAFSDNILINNTNNNNNNNNNKNSN